MLLRRGDSRDVCFVSCLVTCMDGLVGSPGDVFQVAAVRDRAAVSAQEHGPPASGTACLAPHRSPAHFGAGFANGLNGGYGDGSHAFAAK